MGDDSARGLWHGGLGGTERFVVRAELVDLSEDARTISNVSITGHFTIYRT